MKHFRIPIFIPHLSCPFTCSFCNQRKISGVQKAPEPKDISNIIRRYLKTFPTNVEKQVEIAFFGGSFTAIPLKEQEVYLKEAFYFVENNFVDGIRISTRPDFINEEILTLLKRYKVTTVELGVQSLDNEVLKASKRGYLDKAVYEAAKLLKQEGFLLGLQMMIGLPEDSFEKSLQTAKGFAKLGADFVRIYPTLVIKDTDLETLFLKGEYKPLKMNEAVLQSAKLLEFFEQRQIKVIRLGLHPSKELLNKEGYLAGPFHPSFREFVESEIWHKKFLEFFKSEEKGSNNVEIFVAEKQINYAIGFQSKNRNSLKQSFKKIAFKVDPKLLGRDFYVHFY